MSHIHNGNGYRSRLKALIRRFNIRNVNAYASRLKSGVSRFNGVATQDLDRIPVTKSKITPGYAIWYTGKLGSDLWEAHWIEFLFDHIAEHLNKANVLVANTWDAWRPIVESINNRKDWILVVVDEGSRVEPEILQSFLLSLRIGFATQKYGQNVLTVPLNVPGPFLDSFETPPAKNRDRQYIWCFVGDGSKQDRPEMLEKLKALQPHFVHTHVGWMPSKALRPGLYARVLSESIFAPSPLGNIHPECYRTYEALHCGAVPIVTTRYYEQQFEAPFPVVENWEEATGLMEALIRDEKQLARTRAACMSWYRDMPDVSRSRLASALRTTARSDAAR